MRLCQGIHVIFLPSFQHAELLLLRPGRVAKAQFSRKACLVRRVSGIATSRFQNRQMASAAVCATGNRPSSTNTAALGVGRRSAAVHSSGIWLNCALGHTSFVLRQAAGSGPWCHGMSVSVGGVCLERWMMSTTWCSIARPWRRFECSISACLLVRPIFGHF
jgi:hypothetical protein